MLPLVGRERELGVLDGLVDAVGDGGSAMVVCGEPGIGKSALLAMANRRATDRGMQVLTAIGVQSEAHLPFAGLHQLLRPIIAGAEGLPVRQRVALLTAFGMTEVAAPDRFLIALAALELLADTAARAPLLLIVEDAQWLDRPTSDVLAFVARRLASEPIVLLAAVRQGHASALGEAGLPELRLAGLEEAAAAALLAAHAPELAPWVRKRLLAEAAGNPLALLELPAALPSDQLRGGALPEWLPLTARLEHAFAARVSELPAMTRRLLLVAAVDHDGALAEVLAATALLERRWRHGRSGTAGSVWPQRRWNGRPGSPLIPLDRGIGCCGRLSWSSRWVAGTWCSVCSRRPSRSSWPRSSAGGCCGSGR